MKLLLDTDILIDYFSRRGPFFQDIVKLRIAALFGDVELWACLPSFSDVECILGKAIPPDALRSMMEQATTFLKIASPAATDLNDALASGWPNLEDFLIARCAERVKADRLITRDVDGFKRSPVPAQIPSDFLDWLERTHGLVYDEIDLQRA